MRRYVDLSAPIYQSHASAMRGPRDTAPPIPSQFCKHLDRNVSNFHSRVRQGDLVAGNVSKVVLQMSYGHPEFVAVDKETNDDIMHLNRLGKADRLAGQALNPGT